MARVLPGCGRGTWCKRGTTQPPCRAAMLRERDSAMVHGAPPQAETAVAEARLLHPKLPASGSSSHKKNLQRPYEGPVFLVDVFRIGVDDPVDAVVITDETLPPRKNKKGKIAWRLPDLESAKGGRLVSKQLVRLFFYCSSLDDFYEYCCKHQLTARPLRTTVFLCFSAFVWIRREEAHFRIV